jgi:hypothetical protein
MGEPTLIVFEQRDREILGPLLTFHTKQRTGQVLAKPR